MTKDDIGLPEYRVQLNCIHCVPLLDLEIQIIFHHKFTFLNHQVESHIPVFDFELIDDTVEYEFA